MPGIFPHSTFVCKSTAMVQQEQPPTYWPLRGWHKVQFNLNSIGDDLAHSPSSVHECRMLGLAASVVPTLCRLMSIADYMCKHAQQPCILPAAGKLDADTACETTDAQTEAAWVTETWFKGASNVVLQGCAW